MPHSDDLTPPDSGTDSKREEVSTNELQPMPRSIGASVARPIVDMRTVLSEGFFAAQTLGSRWRDISSFGASLSERWAEQVRPFAPVFHQIDAAKSALEATKQQINVFLGPAWSTFGGMMQQLQQVFDDLGLSLAEVGPVFVEAGFWISRSTPYLLLHHIKLLHEQGELTPAILTQLILDTYRADDHARLRDMVDEWSNNSLFASRMLILKDALAAHVEGKYTLSVPALLPQIEGIASEIVGVTPKQGRKAVRGAIEFTSSDFLAVVMREALLAFVEGRAYVSIDFDDFTAELDRLGVSPDQFLNRHAILHGVHVNYGSEENSLRAFLLLDMLSDSHLVTELGAALHEQTGE